MVNPQFCATGTSAGPELEKVMRTVFARAVTLPSGEAAKYGRTDLICRNHPSGQYRWTFRVWQELRIRLNRRVGGPGIRPDYLHNPHPCPKLGCRPPFGTRRSGL